MKKLTIIWSNGDEEKVDVSDEYANTFNPEKDFKGFRRWALALVSPRGVLNLEHAREVYLEEP